MYQLTVPSEMAELDRIRSFLKKSLEGIKISEENYFQVELSLQEICVNIIRYAYPKGKGDINLRIWVENHTVYVEVKDSGIPFDPRTAKKPELERMLKDEKRGGLGIHISRHFMDGFDYRRKNDFNILLMYKNIPQPE